MVRRGTRKPAEPKEIRTHVEVILSLRFFFYQYGIVYHLNLTKSSKAGEDMTIIVLWQLLWVNPTSHPNVGKSVSNPLLTRISQPKTFNIRLTEEYSGMC